MLDHLLTDQELDLVIELLSDESKRLAVDTRHSESNDMTRDLRARLRTVDRLIERFNEFKIGQLKP